MTQKFLFELTPDEINKMCFKTKCEECQLRLGSYLCAKDLQYKADDMKNLLYYLLKEVYYDSI